MWCIEWCHFQRTDDTRATGTLSVGNANQVDVGVGPHYTMWPPFCQSLVGACLISPSWRHQQCTRKWLLRVHHLLQANRSRILECRQRIEMWWQAMALNQRDEVSSVQDKQDRPQHRPLRYSTHDIGGGRPWRPTTRVLRPTRQIRPEPARISNVTDVEGHG